MKFKCFALSCALTLINSISLHAMQETESSSLRGQYGGFYTFDQQMDAIKYLNAHAPSSNDSRVYNKTYSDTELSQAIENKDLVKVKTILDNKPRPKITLDNVLSAIDLEGEQIELLDLLVTHGAPVNSKICSTYGNYENFGYNYGTIYFPNATSPLILATQKNKPNIVKYLLAKKADPLKCYKKTPNVDCGHYREELFRTDYHTEARYVPKTDLLAIAPTPELRTLLEETIQKKIATQEKCCCTIQ
jgi:hypothetical protein